MRVSIPPTQAGCKSTGRIQRRPSTILRGETLDGFVVTLHSEFGSSETVAPTQVIACQPLLVAFSENSATAPNAGSPGPCLVHWLPVKEGNELRAACYVSVLRPG